MTAHPNCTDAHVCQKPSGRVCITAGCYADAGTIHGPLWCPEHDRERLERGVAALEALQRGLGGGAA